MDKTFYFHGGNRQGKAGVLMHALETHGWQQTAALKSKLVFVDSDTDGAFLDSIHRRGKTIIMYPHAARPNLLNDFDGYPVSPHITAGAVVAQDHIAVLRIIGIEYPLEIIGWYLSPIKLFQPRESYRKVLFAPIHPNSDNSLSDIDKNLNHDTFEILVQLARDEKIELTVRYIGTLEACGIWQASGIKYKNVKPEMDITDIEQADVVISHQTFAYLAVALGVPCLMMGENLRPRIGCEKKKDFKFANSWDSYKHIIRYPLDILSGDPLELLQSVIKLNADVEEWKNSMIGCPFDAGYFAKRMESYL